LQSYGDRATIHPTGIWSHTTGLVVCKGQFGDQQEWSTQVRECRAGETADIQAMDHQTILEKSGFDAIDLLKIDIERSEAEVFSVNYETWLKRTRSIVIELHDSDCERIFFQALSSYAYALSRFGEVTICKSLQSAAG
jgi:FkbM family methyltransferase